MSNEKRLIDANEIEELFYKQVEQGATDLMDAFDYALEDAKIVDAVEVVRCKDCKKYFRVIGREEREVWGCRHFGATVKADDFCSYGKRKEL